LVGGLLKQLSQEQSTLPGTLRHLYDQHRDKRTRPLLAELVNTFHDVATMYSRVFIVVDALGECQVSDDCRMRFLSEVFQLQAKCGANLFATSRFIPDIMEMFKESVSLEIRARDEDVRRYLGDRISKSKSNVLARYSEEIITQITKAVDGMWVSYPVIRTERILTFN
jgi:hypothetical protein